jgi:hypothetical protein
MSATPKRQFTHEYRTEAVKLVTEQGMKVIAPRCRDSVFPCKPTPIGWFALARASSLQRTLAVCSL